MERPGCTKPMPSKRIAIVGGGISGIACMWALRPSPQYEVHLFEAEDHLGGHANTVSFERNGIQVNVDSGVIAINEETYPALSNFLKQLDVQTIPTDMSFSVSVQRGKYEWGSHSAFAFTGMWSNLVKPWFWRLCFDIVRFNLTASRILSGSTQAPLNGSGEVHKHIDAGPFPCLESIGEYLERMNYSKQFASLYLVPMVASPWCIDPEDFARDFPAAFLIEFMKTHRLLDTVWHRLQWRTFPKGCKAYIDAFLRTVPLSHRVRLNERVRRAERRSSGGGVQVIPDAGPSEIFDHVVLAVHANQVLDILGNDATAAERRLLSAFKTSKNICTVHSDTSLLPKRLSARSSWNCLLEAPAGACNAKRSAPHNQKIAITFDMNRLQGFPMPQEPGSPGHVLVTMNSPRPISSPWGSYTFFHPLFTSESVQAARLLHEINGVRDISFAGAWMGYGFHEDGFVAGENAARRLLQGDGAVLAKSNAVLKTMPQIDIKQQIWAWRRLGEVFVLLLQFCIDVWTLIWAKEEDYAFQDDMF